MKYHYYVVAQPARAGSPSFYSEGIPELLDRGIEIFNMKSLVAKNPKFLSRIDILDDLTIKIYFKSTVKLKISQAARSLRVLSMFLVDEKNKPNLSQMVLGSRLFKMNAYEDEGPFSPETSEFGENKNDISNTDRLLLEIIHSFCRQNNDDMKLIQEIQDLLERREQ